MKNLRYLLAMAMAALLVSCAGGTNETNGEEEPAGALFIIGGGSRPAAMIERLIAEAGLWGNGYAVILPMSSAEPDSAIIWSSEQFLEQGMDRLAGFNFLPGETPDPARVDSLRHANLIYISGGDQNRFMDIVLGTPIMDAIHEAYANGAVIAGTSAGAAVMSEKMITGNELRYPEYRPTFPVIESENLEIARGLGLLDNAIIDQHFVWRSRHNRLITAVLEHPHLPGIGIDESTAILVRGNKAEVVGVSQVLVFRNPGHSRTTYNEKIGGVNLRLDVYLPGETFSLE